MAVDALQARVDELESRLAWQDQTIDELNTAIAEQAMAITRLEDQLKLMSQRLKSVSEGQGGATPAGHEPPPHY